MNNTSFDLNVVIFDRHHNILPRDFTDFLKLFAPEKLNSRKLRDYYNKVVFLVHGYDDDPRELPEIPEVRIFFQKLNEVWPYFAFFVSTAKEASSVFIPCVVPETLIVRRDAANYFSISYSTDSLLKVIKDSVIASLPLFNRASVGDPEQRLRELFATANTLSV